ncbi:MFS transporter [Waterburya agarophytonicola K14]|uniref:MFS transporter n=1 Tax=Waterburya agarophytonicola KI4 TaxID=2874699 RepID=A0A964BRS0_9CYAN|nr:MFS transporter [Waterburya agarophytonicola KI4]
MEAWKVLETETKQKLINLFSAGLLFWISITLMLPTLPTYIQSMGGTTQQVGMVMSCFAIGLIASRTWLGKVADLRSRKLVILIGSFVAASAPIGYLMVRSIIGLGYIRAFHGISIAAFTIGYSALVVDLSPLKYRGTLIGYMNLAVPIGMSVGPALGGFLQESGKKFVPDGTGYEVLFLISIICGVLAFLLASQIKESSLPGEISQQDANSPIIKRDFWQITKDPGLVVPTIVLMLIGLVFGTLVAFLPLFVTELQLDFNVGFFYTVVAIASFSVRLFIGQASDRYGRGLFISGSLVCYIISMVLLTQAETPMMFILAAIAEGSGAGILIPLILALISDRSYANERGKVFALCMGGFDVGIAMGGLILGSLAGFLGGYRGIFALAAVLATMALGVFMTQAGKNMRHSLFFALGQAQDTYALKSLRD